jgi:hypothetical protein
MGDYDDDERANAYNRHIYHEFANIVQHYADTARPVHDDIDYDPIDYDGAEFDHNGNIVSPSGDIHDVILSVLGAIDEFGSFDDIPDDYNLPDNFFHYDDYDDHDDDCPRTRGNNSSFKPRYFIIGFIPKPPEGEEGLR